MAADRAKWVTVRRAPSTPVPYRSAAHRSARRRPSTMTAVITRHALDIPKRCRPRVSYALKHPFSMS